MSRSESAFHPEVMPERQRSALRRISRAADEHGFYLAGGTALALRLGHRQSVDFDWFRSEAIPDPLGLAHSLREACPDLEVETTARGTLHARIEQVRTSFFQYAYPLLRPPSRWADFSCAIAAREDIAAMKLAAVAQRGARKDFFDIAALLRSGFELGSMLDLYREKFSIGDSGHVLVALTWFEDAERDPEPVSGSVTSWEDVKALIRARVRDLVG